MLFESEEQAGSKQELRRLGVTEIVGPGDGLAADVSGMHVEAGRPGAQGWSGPGFVRQLPTGGGGSR